MLSPPAWHKSPCLNHSRGGKLGGVFRTLGIICTALALFSIAGGHWAVVQTVAWAEMLRTHSQHGDSLAVAVEQTFDGQHPCALCQAIALAKSGEHKQSPATPGLSKDAPAKAILADVLPCPAYRAPVEAERPRAGSFSGPSRNERPPTPPPRRAQFAA